MQISYRIDIGIREIRQLTSFIKEKHGMDFSEFALTSFKRRVEGFLIANKISMDTLLMKLASKEFLDHFVGCIAVGTTEMFRDPTFWILMKNIYIANIFKEHSKAKIWMPMCASGEEYYSLVILLKECGWADCAEIYLSAMSNETLENIQCGYMEKEKLEISTKNYSRFQGASQLANYFKNDSNEIMFDRSLFASTKFFREGLEFSHELPYLNLIFFRNQLIYFNPSLQYKVCDILHSKLMPKGLLALGILEEIELTINSKYTLLNKSESLYQRKS